MWTRARRSDLLAALTRLPGRDGWRRAGLELAWGLPLLLLVAHAGGLFRLQPGPDAITILGLAATLFVAPALGEELLFRGLIVPLRGRAAGWTALSVLLFVLWHPLQAATIGPPWAGAFLDPWFLGCVAVLGVVLARIYRATGSIWAPVFVHWAVVLFWKSVGGGPF